MDKNKINKLSEQELENVCGSGCSLDVGDYAELNPGCGEVKFYIKFNCEGTEYLSITDPFLIPSFKVFDLNDGVKGNFDDPVGFSIAGVEYWTNSIHCRKDQCKKYHKEEL